MLMVCAFEGLAAARNSTAPLLQTATHAHVLLGEQQAHPCLVRLVHQQYTRRCRFQQTVGSIMLAFCGCIFVQTCIITVARHHGINVSSIGVMELLGHAAIVTSTFADCWTDAEISALLFREV